jgi:hypothetical protein
MPEPAARAPGAPGSAATAPAAVPKSDAGSAKKLARLEKTEKLAPVPPGAGRLELAVAPWGEVLVDGKRRGVSPPLRMLDVAAGPHTIEIRNSTFPAHVQRIEVKEGEAVKIRHRFR